MDAKMHDAAVSARSYLSRNMLSGAIFAVTALIAAPLAALLGDPGA